jgi:sugar phosphate isomerase/epimerase
VGQAVCDRIDERHKDIVPPRVWGDGKEDGVRARAAEEMKNTARAAAKMGVKVVPGFTGSPIWHLLYSFPPVTAEMIDKGYAFFAEMWNPILDVFDEAGVRFALEAHPTEIAFDIASAERAVAALGGRKAFGFNYDPSHFGYQGVDYVAFIRRFSDAHLPRAHERCTGRLCQRGGRVSAGTSNFGEAPLLGFPLAGARQHQL